jgi:hypothetical protein
MSEKDFAIGVAVTPPVGALSKKPAHLITLEGKPIKRFISIDKPELLNGFIQVKGIYSEEDESEIVNKFPDLLTNSPKELILEVWFPLHKISSIRSLVFRAK